MAVQEETGWVQDRLSTYISVLMQVTMSFDKRLEGFQEGIVFGYGLETLWNEQPN